MDILYRRPESIELFGDNSGDTPNINKNMESPPMQKDEVENDIKKIKHVQAPGQKVYL